MGKENIQTREAILSYINLCSPNISQIVKYFNLSRPTIYHYIEVLEKQGLVKRDKDKTKKGFPVTIIPNKQSISNKSDKDMIKFLNLLSDNNGIEDSKFDKILRDNEIPSAVTFEARLKKLFLKEIKITEEGKEFLQQHSAQKDRPSPDDVGRV